MRRRLDKKRLAQLADTVRRRKDLRALAAIAQGRRIGAWIVGGAPRDLLLERPALDIDVTLSGDVESIAKAMESQGFGTAVEISSKPPRVFRVAGRREMDLVELDGASIAEDLARRDFTVNAIAIDLASGEWLDPFRGLSDVKRRRLTLVRERNVAQDPLRAFRAARFLATHGLTPDRATAEVCRASAPRLGLVAPERIRTELAKMLEAERPSAAFLWAARRGLLSPALGLPASRVRWEGVGRALASLDRPWVRRLPAQRRRHLRLASIAWRLGLSAARAASWLRNRRNSREEAGKVARLLTLIRQAGDARTLRSQWRWVRDAGEQCGDAARLLACLDPRMRPRARKLATLASRRRPSPAISGSDVLAWLGVPPGPLVGRFLQELEIERLSGTVKTRSEARRWLQKSPIARRLARSAAKSPGPARAGSRPLPGPRL